MRERLLKIWTGLKELPRWYLAVCLLIILFIGLWSYSIYKQENRIASLENQVNVQNQLILKLMTGDLPFYKEGDGDKVQSVWRNIFERIGKLEKPETASTSYFQLP